MSENNLEEIALKMVADEKGLLAADESLRTAKKRLEAVGMEDSEDNRRLYRQLFFTTSNISNYLSGVILFEETFFQETDDGRGMVELLEEAGILPGIKVDQGTVEMPGSEEEVTTRGLDDLKERLELFERKGAKFAKWRAVTKIGEDLPTEVNLEINAWDMARYAKMSQEAGLVPIVEPEVLLSGNHSLEQAKDVTRKTLQVYFDKIKEMEVDLAGLILKTSMVVPGDVSGEKMVAKEVAEATVGVLGEVVPEEVTGIVFLSGGQSADDAMDNLKAINKLSAELAGKEQALPWPLTFSFARALQGPALKVWSGDVNKVKEAQVVFEGSLKDAVEARRGG